MKIIIAHNRYSSAQPSGENSVVDLEIRLLSEAGLEVVPFIRNSDEIAGMSLAQRVSLPVSPIYARRAHKELSSLLARERPDVLHLHNPYPLLSPWVVRTAQSQGVPVVQTVHNYRHVCVSGVFFRDGKPCHDCVGRGWAAPAVQHACYRGSRAQSVVMATALAVHRSTWQRVDRFVALTPAIAAFLNTMGIPDERITIKPNAVPDPGAQSHAGDGFLFAGRLSAEKGIELLLQAWGSHPDGSMGQLTIAGDGPLRTVVEAFATTRSDVRYVGRLDSEDLRNAMRAAAVVVVPSTWDDVCPVVAVEALANAKPVLATDMGGLPWLIGAREADPAGWVVEPRARSLAAGLAMAREGAARLSKAARHRYEHNFSPAMVTARLIEIYRGVLAVDADRSS